MRMSQKEVHQASALPTKASTANEDEDESSNALSQANSVALSDEVREYLNRKQSVAYKYYPGAERDSYDYVTERYGIHTISIPEAAAHLIKGSIGAGALTMHEAFKYGGLWSSLIATVLIGLINMYGMYMLVTSAQSMYRRLRVSKLTYPELAEVAVACSPWPVFRKYSKKFRHLVEFNVVLLLIGAGCVYQILIAQTLKQVLHIIFDNLPSWLDDIRMCIFLSTPWLFILCTIRSLKILAPFAMVADTFIAMCVLTTLYYGSQTGEDISDRPARKCISDFMKFCGMCIYCTSGAFVILPVENHMKRSADCFIALKWAAAVVILLAAATGFFGYWAWGESCTSPITIHMPTNIFTVGLQFFMYIMLGVTFVLHCWVPFRILWYYISKQHKRTKQRILLYYETLYRILFATLITIFALLFPNLIPVMDFLGLFIMGFTAFVYPAFIEILTTWESDRLQNIKWRLPKNIVIITFGLFLTASAFIIT